MRPVPFFILAVALLSWFAVGNGGGALAAEPADWELVWSDEFDGDSVDLKKWEFEVNGDGGGNRELQYYLTNNARVSGGQLQIEARRERYTGRDGTREYTSSRLRTRRKGDWVYGR